MRDVKVEILFQLSDETGLYQGFWGCINTRFGLLY